MAVSEKSGLMSIDSDSRVYRLLVSVFYTYLSPKPRKGCLNLSSFKCVVNYTLTQNKGRL